MQVKDLTQKILGDLSRLQTTITNGAHGETVGNLLSSIGADVLKIENSHGEGVVGDIVKLAEDVAPRYFSGMTIGTGDEKDVEPRPLIAPVQTLPPDAPIDGEAVVPAATEAVQTPAPIEHGAVEAEVS